MNNVYVICYRDGYVKWIREFENQNAAEEYIAPRPYVTDEIGMTKIIVEPKDLIPTVKDIVKDSNELDPDDIDEDLIEIMMWETYNKEYYDIDMLEDMSPMYFDQQIVIFKNKNGKFIKGIVFQNGISVEGAKEYDSLEECKKGGEKRTTILQDIYIEGGMVYIVSSH